VAWPFSEKGAGPEARFLLKKRVNLFSKDSVIALITDLRGTCESFQFYLAASCCDSESKQEQGASFDISSGEVRDVVSCD